MQRGEIGGTIHIAPDRTRVVIQMPMSDTARFRRLSAVLLLSATTLAAASCATLLGTRGRNCPNGADLIVLNRSGETVDILLVQEHNEIVLGTAPSGRSVFGLPDGTGRDARFKSRRARTGTAIRRPFDEAPATGSVSFTVQCL